VLNRKSETQYTEPQLTTGDKDLVNWFFLRLETSYGQKFWTQFSDEKTVLLTKREFAGRITKHSREDLHTAIELMKERRENGDKDFEWPDIPKILGLLSNRISPSGHNSSAYLSFDDPRHPSYEVYRPRLESDEIKSKRKEKAKSALSGLKGMFQMTTEEIVNRINQAGSRNELRVELDEIQAAIAKEKCDFDEQGWDSIKSAAESKKLELGIE